MNCGQVQEVFNSFMEGTLRGEESRAVRMHLAFCHTCASKLSPFELMEILPALDQEIEPSQDFAWRFHAKLQERRQAFMKRPNPWWRSVFAWGRPRQLAAIGALAALMAAGIFLGKYPGSARNPAEYFNDIAVAENLPLLKDMAVISNLDLLEDFDAIEDLTLEPEGSKIQRSNP
jgi:hypothetical protein